MQKKFSIVLIVILILLLFISFYYNLKFSDIQHEHTDAMEYYEDTIQLLSNKNQTLTHKNEMLTQMIKSHTSAIYEKEQSHVEKVEEKLSPEAIQVQGMLKNMEKGWKNMMLEKDPDNLLQFFLPEYTTNSVKINTENMPFVQRHNQEDFREHLDHLVKSKDLLFSFAEPKFYNTIARGNIFTSSYLALFTATHQGEIIHKSTILCFVSGEKKEGKWLIGNYNWIRYDEFDASKDFAELSL